MPIQDRKGAVTVSQVGRVDGDGEDEAEAVDEEMALLAFGFLARIMARRAAARHQMGQYQRRLV